MQSIEDSTKNISIDIKKTGKEILMGVYYNNHFQSYILTVEMANELANIIKREIKDKDEKS